MLQASAARTGVHYLIWYGGSGTPAAPRRLAALHRCRRLQHHPTSPASITGGHYDHVDISVY